MQANLPLTQVTASCRTVRTAVLGELFRGVSFTPGSHQRWCLDGQAGRLSLSA
jgi:hypothetical protein